MQAIETHLTKMYILRSLCILLWLNVSLSGQVSAVSDILEKSILDGSTTSGGKVSSVLRDILNQESLVRFSMVQRIQNLVMDVIDNKNNSQVVKQKMKILTKELKKLDRRDNGIETEVTKLKQVLTTLNSTYKALLEDVKQLKNGESDVRNKNQELSKENDFFRKQLNDVKNSLRVINGSVYEEIENSIKTVSVSINETMDGLLEDHKVLNQQVLSLSSSLTTGLIHRNCYEMLIKNPILKGKNGVYSIAVGLKNTSVYCDMTTDGGGWTVIQKRIDGSTDFYRTWKEYKKGFGDPKNNYWIGNDAIHALTKDQDQELRVDLQRFNGDTAYAEYSMFYIGNEAAKYQLTVSGYTGTAGDSFTYHNGNEFSTKDQDNDLDSRDCAVQFHGAWWYYDCHRSNLNGEYARYALFDWKYPTWKRWKFNEALKLTQMMIRHRN
ncbi:fibrinogen C domain-containing protein 1-B-like [Saccostrea cucullata]|uniref:fibrinogen C domain-containing protein 1-B-like n=1 Tax=Saccostrea cuccullata TaxID=36930 RepID=UPI002ED0F092